MKQKHPPRPIGWFLPIQVIEKWQSGKLESADVMLWGVISSIAGFDEVIITNKELAEEIGKGEQFVSDRLAKLKRIGLIKIFDAQKYRRIKIPFGVGEMTYPGRRDDLPSSEIDSSSKSTRTRVRTRAVLRTTCSSHTCGFGLVKKQKASKISILCDKLEEVIREKRNLLRTPSKKRWEKYMKELTEAVGNDYQRIENAIEWYRVHGNDDYVPVVHSAEQFMSKFTAIEDRMQKDSSTQEEVEELPYDKEREITSGWTSV